MNVIICSSFYREIERLFLQATVIIEKWKHFSVKHRESLVSGTTEVRYVLDMKNEHRLKTDLNWALIICQCRGKVLKVQDI